MKTFTSAVILFVILGTSCSEKQDLAQTPIETEPTETQNVVQNDIKFQANVFGQQQVLTAKNEIIYHDYLGEVVDLPFLGFCGTVPHYELTIEDLENEFVLYKDETFFDIGNEITPEVLARLPKEKVDSVSWLNGQHHFLYNTNSTIGVFGGVEPDSYFIYKDGMVKVSSDLTNTWYDGATAIKFCVFTEKEGKLGVLNVIDPQFLSLGAFTYHLARYKDLQGKEGYLSAEGELFPD